MARTKEECEAMVEAFRSKGIPLYVCVSLASYITALRVEDLAA
jgi:hypothetical protein